VAPDLDAHLKIDSEIDASLAITDRWIGLQFVSEPARVSEGKLAADIARRWTESDAVAVLTVGGDRRRPTLEGARYHGGVQVRRARIYIDRADSAGTSQLARYLADGTPGEALEILEVRRIEVAPPPIEPRLRGQHIPFVVLGIGAAAALGSTAWIIETKEDDHEHRIFNNLKTAPITTFVSSSVVIGAGVYLYLRVTESAEIAPAALLGTGAALLLSGGVLIAVDESPYVGLKHVQPKFLNSAPLGLVVGSVGGVLAGVGAWLLGQDYRDATLPIVTVDRGGGFVGWSGRF
jgi:hypothetical protein